MTMREDVVRVVQSRGRHEGGAEDAGADSNNLRAVGELRDAVFKLAEGSSIGRAASSLLSFADPRESTLASKYEPPGKHTSTGSSPRSVKVRLLGLPSRRATPGLDPPNPDRGDGAFMEPRGRNRRQSAADRQVAKTAETRAIRCRALRPLADRSAW
jgi:hypothetical protein